MKLLPLIDFPMSCQPIKEQKARLKTRPKPGGHTQPGRQSSLECGVLQPLSVSHEEQRAQGSNF